MKILQPRWQSILALLAAAASVLAGPMTTPELQQFADPGVTIAYPFATTRPAIMGSLVLVALLSMAPIPRWARITALLLGAHAAAWLLVRGITGFEGTARAPFYLLLASAWLLAWLSVSLLSEIRPNGKASALVARFLTPAVFGVWILILWEAITRGAGIPFVLLPPPSLIGLRIFDSLPILQADVVQTVLKAALAGYAIGSVLGMLTAVLADRFLFLRNGLLPIGNMVSALPIIGVAPIMVMWFGFGWESKAAVVAIMTFFPMMVNTVAGLTAAGHMERDLMRTYAASYWQTLAKLRLPAAAPFIFNALKINSTLAMIGAIVAEFFGTPTVGMGFRISAEVGRMNVDMVWAEIAAAALVGSVFYGLVALAERAVTFWHPSIRGG